MTVNNLDDDDVKGLCVAEGDHTVDVNYAGVPIQGSPFTCRVYDSQKIKVGEIQNGQVGQAVHFIGMVPYS